MVRQIRDNLEEPDPKTEGEILVLTADGKGVPVVHEAVKENFGQKRIGPKRGCKKVATVGCVYTVDLKIRSAPDVIESLWGRKTWDKRDVPPHATNKRIMATLTTDADGAGEVKSKDAVFRWASGEVENRLGVRGFIVRLLDGDPFLRDSSDQILDLPDGIAVVDVLDLLHVAGYLWTASSCFCNEGSREASDFVEHRMRMLLEGKVHGVVSGLRQMCTKWEIEGKPLKKVEGICAYFENNADRMRYDIYLERGLPIASGVIEGACRYVVKDRMERTGTRWREDGAISMLALRTTKLNGDWPTYQETYRRNERRRLYDDKFMVNQAE